ncbi:hypothetical protein BGZ83_008006 [Gryganskiella cystojenkinii]|nr:hypothetical protein BGZ83_008006 [Gryganskiella cystojenkinii]
MIPQAELEQTPLSVEKLYGDCSEVMVTLFNDFERDSAQEIESIKVSAGTVEQIIGIDQSDPEAKLEGYKKILRLLIADDPALTQEVVRTVNHLLEFKDDHPDIADLALVAPGLKTSASSPSISSSKQGTVLGFNPKSLLSRSSVQLSRPQSQNSALPPRPKSLLMDRHLSRGPSPFDSPRSQSSGSSLKNMTNIGRVSQAISEVRGMFVQELGRIFPQLKDQDGLGILGMGSDETGHTNAEKNYIPNVEQIQFTIAYYSQLIGQDGETVDRPDSPSSAQTPDPADLSGTTDAKSAASTITSEPTKPIPIGKKPMERRVSLKKMVSSPDLHKPTKFMLEARRNSEDRLSSELSQATLGAAVELAQEEEYLRKSQPDNVLKEFMRSQGALRSLMSILSDGAPPPYNLQGSKKTTKHALTAGTRLATKIDIMETICKVLFQNSSNQSEFNSMDGYSVLLQVFDEIVVPAGSTRQLDSDSLSQSHGSAGSDQMAVNTSGDIAQRDLGEHETPIASAGSLAFNKRSLLLGSLLAVFFDLTLDGSTRDMVQNMDAFHFLFRLLLESKQLDIRQHALYAIQDLVSLNALNAVAAWRSGQVDLVIGKLRDCLTVRPRVGSLFDAQWELGRQLGLDLQANTHHVHFANMTYFGDFVVSEDTAVLADMVEHSSPVYQYVVGLTRLLEYIAVMLVQDNAYILYELSRLLMEIEFPDDSSIVINIVLRSVGRIISDMVARGVPVEEKFASIYLQMVRRMLDSRSKSQWIAKAADDEQEQELRDCVHTEQRLLTLHILGLVLKGMGSNAGHVFELLQGFETLTSTILLEQRACHHASHRSSEVPATYAASLADVNLCQDCFRSDIVISDLALWLFRELALQDQSCDSAVMHVMGMLKSTLSGIEDLKRQSENAQMVSRYSQTFLHVQPELQQDQAHALLAYLYTKICGTLSLIFRKSSESKIAFGEACGMQILLSVLSSSQHPDIATAALIAIGDFFAGYEGTNALLGDSFGYDGFLEIVLDSCRPLDKMSCEIVLEVATVGNVMSTKTRPHVESDSSIYCTEIWPYVAGLSDIQPLFHAALPFTSPRKIGERNSFRVAGSPSNLRSERLGGSPAFQTNGRGTPSRPSSVYLEEVIENPSPFLQGSSTPVLSGSLPSFAAVASNAGVAPNPPSRYSIFGLAPWSTAMSPTIAISPALDRADSASSIPKFVDPSDPAGSGSSRRSSLNLQRSGASTPAPQIIEHQPTDHIPAPFSKPLQTPKEKGVVNRQRSNSRNLGGFGLNTTNLGFQSVVPSERIAFKQLAGIVFRDADAARMTLRLLGRIIECNNPKLATDYFNLLMLLMEVTPRNKELLGRNNGLRYMLQILFRRGRQQEGPGVNAAGYPYLPRAADPPYVDLVPAIGAYDISVEDVRLLFDAVYDPLSMFYLLTSVPNQSTPSGIKDALGPLPELPAKFDKEGGSRRNSAGRPRSESAGAFTHYSSKRAAAQRYQGSGPGSYGGGLQFNPMFIGEMEQQMMYAIEKISERVDPPAYFNFNGIDAGLTTQPGIVEKAVSAKGGYTVSVWVKVTAFLEKETGLFCYEEENGNRTIFELYFKSLDQSNRYCLCVRTQHYPSPPEDFVFDRFDFAETGIWHHIVFVHHKTMKLMVDGCVIQSYGTFNPRRQEKESAMIGVLGRKGRNSMSAFSNHSQVLEKNKRYSTVSVSSSSRLQQEFSDDQISDPAPRSEVSANNRRPVPSPPLQEQSLGYFCGQAGKVHFLQGEWDQVTAEKVYNLGPASTESWKSYDIKSPVIAILDPEDFLGDMDKTGMLSSEVTRSASTSESQKHGILQGGCTIHKTKAMRSLIGEVGGIQLCFRFLEMIPSHLQLVGLRVISNLLYKSPENIAKFQNELDGYEIMYDLLLSTASELSISHFGVLFDIAINGMVKDEHLILSNMPCVQLILRLLPHTADVVQSYILRTLVDLIVESSENMRLWRGSFGMTTLFELFKTLPAHLRPFLMWTLESMMTDGMTVQELGLLIGFIGHEEPDLFELRRDIIEMLFKRMTTDHVLVDLLGSGLEGVTVMIGLLDAPNEHFRILILKMIGILLNDNTKSGKAALDKPNIGIGLIRSTLEKYPLSMDVIQVLLGLAQNSYRCDPNFRLNESRPSLSRKSSEKSVIQQQQSLLSMTPAPKDSPLTTPSTPDNNSKMRSSTIESMIESGSQGSESYLEESVSPSSSQNQDTVDPTLSGPPAPRKHVHSNNANAPFIKMSTLPTDAVIIHSAPSATPPANPTSSTSQVSSGGAKITDELTYASMIRLILELTGSLPHTDLVTHTLTDLKRLMTAENMRILWEAGWVNWIGSFMLDKSHVRVTSAAENLSYNRAMGVLDGMMQKMMIFDLSRKGSFTARNKGSLVSRDEDVGVQLRLTEAALAWFDKNPNLDTDAANVICKGLVILFRRLEELSRKFEEKQRQAEKARQEAMDRDKALQAQLRAQELERERLALEAVSSALSGVLDSMGGDSGQSDESDSKSVLLKADEGDTDAEEISMMDRSHVGGTSISLSGSTSPTCSSSSTLSLPHSTFSAAAPASAGSHQASRESFESLATSRSPSANSHLPPHHQQQQQHQHQHQNRRPRPQGRRQHPQFRSAVVSGSYSNSSTPPAFDIGSSSNSLMLHHHHHDGPMSVGGGIVWPPLGLYEHFASCINNLACYNNSAIRSAMKSSGLFKIRDSLIEKLGKTEGGASGIARLISGTSGPGGPAFGNPYLYHPQPQHPSPVLGSGPLGGGSSNGPHNQFVRPSTSSSSSSSHHDSDGNSHLSQQDANTSSNILNTTSNISGPSSTKSGSGGSGQQQQRKRSSQQRQTARSGLGLGFPSVI